MTFDGTPATEGGGTPTAAPGSDDGSGGVHNDGASFWQSNGDYLRQISQRFGGSDQLTQVQPNQTPPQNQADDYQEYLRWKAAKEGKDVRTLLSSAGLQPGDVLNATLFGGPQQEPPKPDRVAEIRSELAKIRTDIEAERQQRQTTAERMNEEKARNAFNDQIGSMQDLVVLQKWGQEAFGTAWNVYIQDVEQAMEARAKGQQVPIPSPRQAALKVENYLRGQASRLGEVLGAGGVSLEPLPIAPQNGAANQAPTVPAQMTNQPAGTSPTLTNTGGHAGAPPSGPTSVDELRKRALAAAQRLRQ